MQGIAPFAESVKNSEQFPQKSDLLRFVKTQIEAARAFVSALELYQMWLTHALVPADRVTMLLYAEEGGMQ